MKTSSFFTGLILFVFIFQMGISSAQSSDPEVTIHYLGHSAFVLQFTNGTTLVTDYGHHNAWVEWGWHSPMTIEGKQKFIPQAERFIDLLKPDRIIPMHFWSEDYRDDFLAYLKTQNDSGKRYRIQESDISEYHLFASESIDSIRKTSSDTGKCPSSGMSTSSRSGRLTKR